MPPNSFPLVGAQLNQRFTSITCKVVPGQSTSSPFINVGSLGMVADGYRPTTNLKLLNLAKLRPDRVKVCAVRKRRVHDKTGTFVLLEPGEEEQFVPEEELKEKLKGYLEKWSQEELPSDLARFETMDEAVSYLVDSACELEIDGDVGSVQWYQVRLEQ